MSLRRSRRLQKTHEAGDNDLLALWFEVNGDSFINAAADLGSLALVAERYRCMVAEKV